MVAILGGGRLRVDLRSVRQFVPASPVGVNDGPSLTPAASVLHQPECKNVGGPGKVPLGRITSFSPGDQGPWNDNL